MLAVLEAVHSDGIHSQSLQNLCLKELLETQLKLRYEQDLVLDNKMNCECAY